MNITQRIETRENVSAICVHLTGDYQKLNYMEAWNKLDEYCKVNHLDYDCPDAEYINVYHDDPSVTPAENCHTDVCIASKNVVGLQPMGDVDITTIYGGRYIVFRYQGPYENLGAMSAKVYGELLPQSGVTIRPCAGVIEPCQMFERYLNDSETTAPTDLLTEIWIPIL